MLYNLIESSTILVKLFQTAFDSYIFKFILTLIKGKVTTINKPHNNTCIRFNSGGGNVKLNHLKIKYTEIILLVFCIFVFYCKFT